MTTEEQILAIKDKLGPLAEAKGERARTSLLEVLQHLASPDQGTASAAVAAATKKYGDFVEERLHPQLLTFALARGAEEYLPHTRMYAQRQTKQKTTFSFRALRLPALLSGGGENVRADALAAVAQSTAPCVAVWTTMMPAWAPGDSRESREFRAFGYLVDSEGVEASFLCVNPGGVVWLPFQGPLLHAHVDALDALTNSGEFPAVREDLIALVLRAVIRQTSTSPVLGGGPPASAQWTEPELSAAVLRDTQMHADLDTLMTAVVAAIGSDGVYFLQVLTANIRQAFDKIDKIAAKATQDLTKTLKRRTDELTRLEKSYEGLKARAERQDRQLRELRSQITPGGPAPEQPVPGATLQAALARLF